jgi:hypothetical protein
MRRLNENAKTQPPGMVSTRVQIWNPDGVLVHEQKFYPPIVTK